MAIDLTDHIASNKSRGMEAVGKIEKKIMVKEQLLREEKNQTKGTVEQETIETVANKLEQHVQSIQRDLNFQVDEESGKTVISVFDAETEELIRQIPSEDLLKLSERMHENKGLLLRKKV